MLLTSHHQYYSECGVKFYHDGNNNIDDDWSKAYGFKRKFSEYFKLENNINGDITNLYTFDYPLNEDNLTTVSLAEITIQPQNTYTFFEETKDITNIKFDNIGSYIYQQKMPWKDYSDLQVNKNQAVPNEVAILYNNNRYSEFCITGNNQLVYIGKIISIDIIPIDDEIKNDFTKWGEH